LGEGEDKKKREKERKMEKYNEKRI